jgi:hypothetical protein
MTFTLGSEIPAKWGNLKNITLNMKWSSHWAKWGYSAVRKTWQNCIWSASLVKGQTRAVNIATINIKKAKFQCAVNLLPHQCHAL